MCNFVNKDKRREKCERRKATDGGLRKTVTITLEPTARTNDRWKATSITAVVYLGIAIVCFVVSGILFKFDLQDKKVSTRRKPTLEEESRAAGEERTLGDLNIEDGETRVEETLADEEGEGNTTIEVTNQDFDEGQARLREVTWAPQVKEGQKRSVTVRRPVRDRIDPLTAPEKTKARYKIRGGLFIISMFYAVTYRRPSTPRGCSTRQVTMTSATTTRDARLYRFRTHLHGYRLHEVKEVQ